MIIQLLKQFNPLISGGKTKAGLYIFLLGLLAKELGLELGEVKGLADNLVCLTGEVLASAGLLHDLYKKFRRAKSQNETLPPWRS